MKRTSRLMAILLAFCLAATTMSTGVTAGAVDTGTTHTITDGDVKALLDSAQVQNGDTIQLIGMCYVNDNGSDAPWIIKKSVTF